MQKKRSEQKKINDFIFGFTFEVPNLIPSTIFISKLVKHKQIKYI